MSDDFRWVQVDGDDSGLRILTLNKPPVNALGRELVEELTRAANQIGQDPAARCVILRSAGKHFCAGADLKERRTMTQERGAGLRPAARRRRATPSPGCPCPTIAAVRGAAAGGGCELALGLRPAHPGRGREDRAARDGAGDHPRRRRHAAPAPPDRAGPGQALDPLRGDVHAAEDALRDGVADRVVPAAELDDAAADLARAIAANGPVAVRAAKRAIDRGLELPLDQALDYEWECYQDTLETEDRLEALQAFAEKRPPRFTRKVEPWQRYEWDHAAATARLKIDPPLILAPMAGVTDRQFRLLLRRLGGVGLVTMEFISSEGADPGQRRTLRADAVQRGGAADLDPDLRRRTRERMAQAARTVEEIGADVCDINMGCPANKVLKGCAGCSLMGDLDLARRDHRTPCAGRSASR